MKRISIPAYSFATKSYFLLTKPGIIAGNLITTAAGFILASKGLFSPMLFLAALFGLGFVIASACVVNNFIDREADRKMARTKNRALARGTISENRALLFAALLLIVGSFLLISFVNTLAFGIALFGYVMYVFVYSFSKYLTTHGTLIGSIAGAVPPVVGYCAASNAFDLGALIFFSMLTLWQMPHFYAISIYRLKDYSAASIPVLPLKKGIHATKVQMLVYVIAFIAVSSLLTLYHYTGIVYLTTVILLGLFWLVLAIQGFTSKNDARWARKMFVVSLVVITSLSIVITLSGF